MKGVFLLACLVVYANAHACIIFPQQRGFIPATILTHPGDETCLHLQEPCGGTQAGNPTVSYEPGTNSSVTVLKNLDHFYPNNPGRWDLNILHNGDPFNRYRVGGIYDSRDFTTLEQRDIYISIPYNIPKGQATLQLVYTTNNPGSAPYYYACSDIDVIQL